MGVVSGGGVWRVEGSSLLTADESLSDWLVVDIGVKLRPSRSHSEGGVVLCSTEPLTTALLVTPPTPSTHTLFLGGGSTSSPRPM